MRLVTALRRSVAVLLVTSALLIARAEAAPIPESYLPDSTAVSGTSASVLDVNSDSRLVLTILATQFILNEHFRLFFELVNTSTVSGGPFPVSGVLLTIILSANLNFIQCLNTVLSCTATPDSQSGGTRITATVGNFAANATQSLEVEVEPVQAGTGSVTATLTQNEFDPVADNNTVSSTFDISEPQNGSVHGFKYEDMNGNGVWDEGEPGLNDWTIRLVQASTETTTLTKDIAEFGDGVTTPKMTGWFEFLEVAPGNYQVHEDVKEGWVQSAPPAVYHEITVDPLESEGPLEFGNYRPVQLQGTTFEDADSNGVFGPGEVPIAGTTVTLVGTTGMGSPVSLTRVSDDNGLFSFVVDPGSYTLDADDSTRVKRTSARNLTVTSGMVVEGQDFGFTTPPGKPVLTISTEPDTVRTELGSLETLAVTIGNTGEGPATNVVMETYWVTQFLKDEFFGLPTNCFKLGDPLTGNLGCPLGDLAPGASQTLNFRFRAQGKSERVEFLLAKGTATNHEDVSAVATFLVAALDIDLGIYRRGASANKGAAAEVDVYLDSTLVQSALAAGTSTGFLEIPLTNTQPMLHVLPAGSTNLDEAELATQLQFGEDGEGDAYSLPSSYFLVLTGGDSVTGAYAVRDAQAASTGAATVSFAVVHAGETLGDVEVATADLGAAPLAQGAVTDYATVSATTQVIEVLDPGTKELLGRFAFDWSNSGGEAFVLVLSDGPTLEAVGADGAVAAAIDATASETERDLPAQITLRANYPNPFNPLTTIGYGLPEATEVRLEVFDALGRRVAVLVEGMRPAGRYEAPFDATDLPSGLYVYRLTAGTEVQARTMVVLK